MKATGMILLLIGLIFILATSVRPGAGDKVHNWSPVNGMIMMGLGAVVYLANVKIRSSEVFPNPEKKRQFYL